MALRVNTSFATLLQAAEASNLDWANALKAGLGATRRVLCVRHADPATPDDQVHALGTVFRDASLTGDMLITAGVVTYYGVTSNMVIARAADLSTGKSVLRIEGNGNWIEGTLGLEGSNCDFVVPANPTTANSIAVAPNTRISPPPFLPSGTGFAPPALDADAPALIIVEDWTNPNAPVEASRCLLNERIANLVFEDSDVAAEMGDLRCTQSTSDLPLGDHIFGVVMESMNAAVNASTPGKAVHFVMITCRPTETNWPRYPRFGGYRKGTRVLAGITQEYGISNTFPRPFKIKICKADGTVLFTHEMRDGKAINDPTITDVLTKTKPLRPQWHCGMMLEWCSDTPVMSSRRHHIFPGVYAEGIRYSLGKEKASFNAPFVEYRYAQPQNSSGHWHGIGKWAQPCSQEALDADALVRTDPYLYNINSMNEAAGWDTRGWMKTYFGVPDSDAGSLVIGQTIYQGWGYEPAAPGCHDHLTGPGGPRIDRAVMPGPVVIQMSNPNWIHLRDNTPINEMVTHWGKNYFNNSWHWMVNPRTGESLPVSEMLAGKWGAGDTFYAGNDSYVSGGMEYTVPFFSVSNGQGENLNLPHAGAFVDANYRMPWNGSAIDTLHNYSCPGWMALLYNSASHAFSQKMRYYASLLCQLIPDPTRSLVGIYAIRAHAWRLFQAAMMWKLAANHPWSIPRADMETRIIGELTAVYNSITVPLNVQNSQEPYFKMLRNFGVPVKFSGGAWYTDSMGLTFYMGHTLQFWRQSGLWRKMYDHSTVTRDALLTIIQTLDVACFGFILETRAAYIGAGGSLYSGNPVFMANNTNSSQTPDVPTGWTDWQSRVWPRQGQEDMIHNVAGGLQKPTSDEHLRMQWVHIRKYYFPDVPCVYDVDAAVTIVEGWQATWAAHVAAQTSERAKSQQEWGQMPGYARILPPTVLEP